MKLSASYLPSFSRDLKKIRKRRLDIDELKKVMELIVDNTPEAQAELVRRHNMHHLKGQWGDSWECHVANAGDWLLVWFVHEDVVFFQRTGTHDEIFR